MDTVVIVTAKGIVLRIEECELIVRKRAGKGVKLISLDKHDEVIGAISVPAIKNKELSVGISLITKQGRIITFGVDDIRIMNRACRGVRGIKLNDGDEVVGII